MKSRALLTLVIATLSGQLPAASTNHYSMDDIMPLIQMEDVPLAEALKALAHQGSINCIMAPEVLASFAGPGGDFVREPSVNFSWTNVTIRQALDDLLKTNKLSLVSNPVTKVARIVPSGQTVQPVSAQELGDNTNAVIPLISMDSVPLAEAIKALARQEKMTVVLDPALEQDSPKSNQPRLLQSVVKIRWENITAKQGLVALLDNYGLSLLQKPDQSQFRIVPKPPAKK